MNLSWLAGWMLLVCFFLGRPAHAGEQTIYQYTDDSGAVVFVEDPSEIPPDKRPKAHSIQMKSESKQKPAAVPVIRKSPEVKTPAKKEKVYNGSPEIVLYMTAWCGYCKKMKSRLEDLGVAYVEKDIEKDLEAGRAFHRYGGSGVPLVVIDGTVIRGYNPAQVERTLEKYR